MESSESPMYIYDLPYLERKSICRILDLNDTWEQLGGAYMKYDVSTLQRVGQAVIRNHSPTDELLSLWGTQNHTILELFVHLSNMQHYQAMMVLKPLVHPKYHRLINEGEENFSRLLSIKKNETKMKPQASVGYENTIGKNTVSGKDFAYGDHNINKVPASGSKVLFEKSSVVTQEDAKLLNTHKKENDLEEPQIAKKVSAQSNVVEGQSPMISYTALERATGGWDRRNLLGKGGFGTVYKGIWKNTQVAIKRLEIQKGGDMEAIWKTQREQSLRELKYLNSYRHDNILPLYGYSIGGPHDCLVYQYMPNGSLEDRLLCREQSKPLNWIQRHNIATGTARGLQFLHTIGDKPLVHGDIKSANILLDPHLEPKIGDFGLAREGPLQQYTHVKVSRVHGTRPYLPDEFLRAKKFSTKVDTYSFGIVLFELASGLRAYDESRPNKFLKDHIEALREDRISEIQDLKGGYDDGLIFTSLIALGKCCTSLKAKDRPEMVRVLKVIGDPREMAKHAQYLLRHNSLTPASPYDHFSQQRRLSLPPVPNQIVQVGGGPSNAVPVPQLPLPATTPPNPRSNSPFATNSKSNTPYLVSPAPSNSLQAGSPNVQLISPQLRSNSTQQTAVPSLPSSVVSPTIRVLPPSAPNLSDLLPAVLNQEANVDCDLPLISELGIKSHNSESFQGPPVSE